MQKETYALRNFFCACYSQVPPVDKMNYDCKWVI